MKRGHNMKFKRSIAFAAVISSLFQTIGKLVAIVFYTGVALGILYLTKLIVFHAASGSLEKFLSSILCSFLSIVLIVLIVVWLGAFILGVVVNIALAIVVVAVEVANGGAAICEKGFVYYLKAIIKRVEKC